jgi:hypothetical protein
MSGETVRDITELVRRVSIETNTLIPTLAGEHQFVLDDPVIQAIQTNLAYAVYSKPKIQEILQKKPMTYGLITRGVENAISSVLARTSRRKTHVVDLNDVVLGLSHLKRYRYWPEHVPTRPPPSRRHVPTRPSTRHVPGRHVPPR